MKAGSVLLIVAVGLLAGRGTTRASQGDGSSDSGVVPGVQNTLVQAVVATASEPTYNGHPLSYWLVDVQFASSASPTPLTDEAKSAVAHIGTNAIPFMLERLRRGDHPEFDDGIIGAFGVLGPAASSAVPELAWLATNQNKTVTLPSANPHSIVMIGYTPLRALGLIGADAMPVFAMIVTNAIEPGRRLGAIKAINSMGSNAVSAVSVLLHGINDGCDPVAWESVRGLGLFGARNPAALTALCNLSSQSPNYQLRAQALFALAHCGNQAASALIRGLDDPQTYFIAFTSLVAASPQSLTNAGVLAIAAEGLDSPEPERRGWAAQVLRAAGQQAGGQEPDYTVPLGNMGLVFQEATNALIRLGPDRVKRR